MNRRDFLLRLGSLAPGLILVPWVPKIMVPVAKVRAQPNVPFYVNGKMVCWNGMNVIRYEGGPWGLDDYLKSLEYIPNLSEYQIFCFDHLNVWEGSHQQQDLIKACSIMRPTK